MNKSFLALIFLLFSDAALARDNSNCSLWINSHHRLGQFLQISGDGKIEPKPGYSFDKSTNPMRIWRTTKGVRDFEVLISKNDQGDFETIKINALDFARWIPTDLQASKAWNIPYDGSSISTTYSFQEKDGKCLPKEVVERSTFDKDGKDAKDKLIYNTELCGKIARFLNEHPEARTCFDQNLNKKMAEMMKPYEKDGDQQLGETSISRQGPQVTPIMRGYSMFERCYYDSIGGLFDTEVQNSYNKKADTHGTKGVK